VWAFVWDVGFRSLCGLSCGVWAVISYEGFCMLCGVLSVMGPVV